MNTKPGSQLFIPGIKIMQKMRFLPKMLVLITVLLIPIILLSYFLHVEVKKVTDFTDGELNGVAYVMPLSEILVELTSDLSTTVGTPKIAEQIKRVDEIDTKLGRELQTTETWNELKNILQTSSPGARKAAIDKTLELIALVGDKSGLVLDPDIDSYYIMDTAIVKYPDILSKTTQIAFLAVDGMTKPSRTVDDQIKMAMVVGSVRSTLDGAKNGVQTSVKANKTLQEGISAFSETEMATTTLLTLVDEAPLKAATTGKDGVTQQIISQLKQTNSQNASAYRLYLKQLNELLLKRLDTVKSHERDIFVITAIGLALAIYLLVALYLAMKDAIGTIVDTSKKFADGDWQDAIRVSTADEFSDIAVSLNIVRDKMQQMIRGIANLGEQVAASSQELTASAEQSALAANQVATAITSVASGAAEQLTAADKTSTVVAQMSASMEQVAASTDQVAAQSLKAADRAQNGGREVEKVVAQMNFIENTVNTSARVVAKLGERSKEIGQIVDTISGIASQTELLALNAAIEAARAGEQGRGFTVVAQEVRKLSEQSQEAAKKIANLIGEIQGDTDKAVVAMQDGTREVKTGAEVVDAAGVAFREIVELVNEVAGQVKDISVAIKQMNSGGQQIVGAVRKIDELSKASASESQSVSAATEEQLASMEEIAASSEALAKLAQDLQAEVTKFRV